jgi:hypothetical protein
MRFVSAVSLAVAMLWVPVDGVAQTQAERRLAESYETRAREIEALINPEADRLQMRSHQFGCLSRFLARTGRPGEMSQAECTAAGRELGDRLADRRMSLEDQAFELRQRGLEILARASQRPPPRAATRPPQPLAEVKYRERLVQELQSVPGPAPPARSRV